LNLIREINTSLILDALKGANAISKLDVAKAAGLSIPTVTKILSGMLRVGVVQEAGIGDSDGGRRPMLYKLNRDGAFVIGSDIGDDHVNSIVVDFLGDRVAQATTPILLDDNEFAVFAKTIATISEAIEKSGKDRSRFLGMGIGLAGEIDTEEGIVKRATYLNWENVPIKSIIESSFHIPTFIDENVRLLTFAESWIGNGKTSRDVICLRVGDDVSAGFMIDGMLFTGKHGMAGPNINHMVIDPNGETCECGSRGCVKTILSSAAIVRYCREQSGFAGSSLSELNKLTVKAIAEAAQGGDALALDIMDYVGRNLAIVVKNLAVCFDPDSIIVGGGIALAGDVLFDPANRYLQECLGNIHSQVRVYPSILGRDAFAFGAAMLVLNRIFSYPGHFAI
jgi:glucokinase-like ROK family protein